MMNWIMIKFLDNDDQKIRRKGKQKEENKICMKLLQEMAMAMPC